jgi:virginiamycin B lyase
MSFRCYFSFVCLMVAGACVSVLAADNSVRPSNQDQTFPIIINRPYKPEQTALPPIVGRSVIQIPSPVALNGMGKNMAVDPKGYVWYTETREDKAIRINPANMEVTVIDLPKGIAPYSFDIDSEGSLWIAAYGTGSLVEVRLDSKQAISHVPASPGFLIHVTVDRRDNTVYTTQPNSNSILSYQAKRGFRQYTLPGTNSGPGRPALDGAGNLWFPELFDNKLGSLDPVSGALKEWPVPVKKGMPTDVFVGKNGSIWLSVPNNSMIFNFADGKFTPYSLPKNTNVSALAADADGKIWFAQSGWHWRSHDTGNKIGVLDPKSSEVTQFSLPNPEGQASALMFDTEGGIWLQENPIAAVCRIAPRTRDSTGGL